MFSTYQALTPALFVRIQLGVTAQPDVGGAQLRLELGKQLVLEILDRAHLGLALPELLLGAAAVDRVLLHAGADLLLEAAHALHEELVEIGAHDGEKLDPFQQGRPRVLGLVEHAPVERQPGQLAVEVPLRRGQVRRRGDGCARFRKWFQYLHHPDFPVQFAGNSAVLDGKR
jgi:hypothetical protein